MTGRRYCIDGAALVFVPSAADAGPVVGDGLTGRARMLPRPKFSGSAAAFSSRSTAIATALATGIAPASATALTAADTLPSGGLDGLDGFVVIAETVTH